MAKSAGETRQAWLRALPSVDQLLKRLEGNGALSGVPRARVVAAVRECLAAERRRILETLRAGSRPSPPELDGLARRVAGELARAGVFSLAPLINATGVVLHTNLGRAILSPLALERLRHVASGYSNLELDVAEKERGSRYAHVDGLLRRLTGAEASLVVNNNAAAVLLALESLARGKEVVVSRGELIEIGGEFRIPDIMRRSGAILREVGTTNRTHLKDYAEAIGPETALLLKVHTSNYRILGFTAQVPARELVELGRQRGTPVMEDLGSGCRVDLRPYGFPYEPTVPEAVATGIDLVTFSGDKLLGGPQAGIVVGRADFVARLTRNPLNRALRVDKLTLAALEATLYAYEAGTALQTLPVLRMLTEPLTLVRRRARRLLGRLDATTRGVLGAAVVEGKSQVGGGALPLVELPTAALSLAGRSADELDRALRTGQPRVVARILEDRLLLDCRTVQDAEVPLVARALTRLADQLNAR
ncbi:MAG: L-seryl-tRNA(Sec) selenium transferase [Candidatus Rokubacteria bacterium]|nr:L-seryl-tRNA(Sec) selenium transferase [Candidatus Rokubacteria bacterium]